jgi:hypothetical protein
LFSFEYNIEKRAAQETVPLNGLETKGDDQTPSSARPPDEPAGTGHAETSLLSTNVTPPTESGTTDTGHAEAPLPNTNVTPPTERGSSSSPQNDDLLNQQLVTQETCVSSGTYSLTGE